MGAGRVGPSHVSGLFYCVVSMDCDGLEGVEGSRKLSFFPPLLSSDTSNLSSDWGTDFLLHYHTLPFSGPGLGGGIGRWRPGAGSRGLGGGSGDGGGGGGLYGGGLGGGAYDYDAYITAVRARQKALLGLFFFFCLFLPFGGWILID